MFFLRYCHEFGGPGASRRQLRKGNQKKPQKKNHEHSNYLCQKINKPMSIAAKTQMGNQLPESENMLPFWAPALGNIAFSHTHAASPRPLARTRDTNTKRSRKRFPDWGQLCRLFPLNLRYIQCHFWLKLKPCILLLKLITSPT